MINLKKLLCPTLFILILKVEAQQLTDTTQVEQITPKKTIKYYRPDSHAPIGVMGDHMHKKGEFMFSYRYMYMDMDGMLNGSDDASNQDVLAGGFLVTPEKMNMQMHMIGVMYAPSNYITLALMGNILANDMDLIVTPRNLPFNTKSGGFGDLKLNALVKLLHEKSHHIHANLGISFPTGNIEQRDEIPVKQNALLAYPMQLGSGTFDPTFGATYSGKNTNFSWGAQSLFTFRINDNDRNYKLGPKGEATTWLAFKATNQFSFSARLSYMQVGSIEGEDTEFAELLNMPNIPQRNLMPLFNTLNSGRKQLDASVGTNFIVPSSSLKGLRIGLEIGLPVYQDVNGFQMKNSWMGTIGIQYAISK